MFLPIHDSAIPRQTAVHLVFASERHSQGSLHSAGRFVDPLILKNGNWVCVATNAHADFATELLSTLPRSNAA